MKSLKWISWNFYFNEKKSDWIEIFQIVQIIFPGGAQQVFQYKGKKVISKVGIYLFWEVQFYGARMTNDSIQKGLFVVLILIIGS